ncbi:transporter [Cupriavidus sp. CV2]|uniref:SphA family protein n=1 Tax=Cupriavidus ulmosensis TaxID=3065913 RepID=UPI00296AEE8B|nr:transporter [Cupriavidus sp. CV2]MDW3681065.1 transporter [Cupriavidus sp. CV2]
MKCSRIEWRIALRRGVLAATLAAAAGGATATENGGSIYPMGAENYMTGALPPPGLYGMVFLNRYEADSLRDNNGNRVPLDFSVRANAISPRLVWVPGVKVLGGDVVVHTIVPLVNLRVQAGNASQTKTGIGDTVFGTGLGYHYSENLHAVFGVDVFAPTGQYNKNDLANIGRNYWAVQPLANFTYVDPTGLNADIKAMYTYNFKNPATNYKSGQEFHFDYALGWGVGGGWVLGAGGYAYWQVSDDKVNAQTLPDNKGRAFAIGPSLKYDSGKGWFVTAKWQKELGVRNRAQGNAFWVKVVFPL